MCHDILRIAKQLKAIMEQISVLESYVKECSRVVEILGTDLSRLVAELNKQRNVLVDCMETNEWKKFNRAEVELCTRVLIALGTLPGMMRRQQTRIESLSLCIARPHECEMSK
jgi:hypothetical protein